jgi:hypothetical protein
MNEWVLITTCKHLVWSTRIGRNIPIWILRLIVGSDPGTALTLEVTGCGVGISSECVLTTPGSDSVPLTLFPLLGPSHVISFMTDITSTVGRGLRSWTLVGWTDYVSGKSVWEKDQRGSPESRHLTKRDGSHDGDSRGPCRTQASR